MVLVLSIIGMICWGITPVFIKIGLAEVSPQLGLFIRTLFTAAIVSSWVLIGGHLGEIKKIPSNAILMLGLEAFLATVIGDLAYYAAIKKGAASMVTIILASSPFVTILTSVIFLKEEVTLSRVFGCFLVVIGIVLAAD